MQLQIKLAHFNIYPIAGLLLQGTNVQAWLIQIQAWQIPLNKMEVFAIPNTSANSIWGCFIMVNDVLKNKDVGKAMKCQLVHNRLYIPEFANIFPQVNIAEMEKIFSVSRHILHPEFGLVALETPISWPTIFESLVPKKMAFIKPAETAFLPTTLKKIEVKALPPEDVLRSMEENAFPKNETFEHKPLSIVEKMKYLVLKTLFSGAVKDASNTEGSTSGNKPPSKLGEALGKMLDKFLPKENKWLDKLQQNLRDLERRNQSEMEKLMELFKNNPEEALKYAIPLDEGGTNRGGNEAAFNISKRWLDFSLQNSSRSGSGNASFMGDTYQTLHQQYTKTAQELVKQKDYEKAAFVYMKLLKNHFMAAQTLEDGKLYPEAAAIFLKHLQNKNKAAECYEKGSMTTEAIGLYKELDQHEKVGDLYTTINNKSDAFKHYHIVIDEHKSKDKFVKASLLYRNKMGDFSSAQDLLLEGWRAEKDAFNCLNNYFDNIKDEKQLAQAVDQVYLNDTDKNNKSIFLSAIKHEHQKHPELKERTKEIAYEIVAEIGVENPSITSELIAFNNDKWLLKDVSRFKQQHR